ncbi:NADP-dependent oxidoreductase [Bacillus horti]|uniref:NADPH:quinone reductase-like Zn-dependent oxidoreductase n=1 Tax=Caldalkalibacillus horti TaxID=77523 RepID=A0ABT9VYS4_9BACI|nr:NADP-dependent oxidoreductase [Bacillus horti]MDQ0166147.1 NADPH:quinone reductase-like Zn-dependent oxidoreductase [Bacillus horti]
MSKSWMKAVRVHEYGDPGVLKVEDVERPVPQAGEVLVRVVYAAVIPLDWKIRSGLLKDVFPQPLPYIPGAIVSGIIESVGENVTEFEAGDLVFGKMKGAYSEYGIVSVSEPYSLLNGLLHVPKNLKLEDAATVGAGAESAWKALFTEGNLESGQTVLIHAAAGGVGQFAVQLAKWKGAKVIGTASGDNVDYVKSLGADQVINYTSTPFEEAVKDVDLVIDTVGGSTQDRSWSVLKPGGCLVTLVQPPSQEKAREFEVTAKHSTASPTFNDNKAVAQLLADGTIKAEVDRIYLLSEVREAHLRSEGRHSRGRILLCANPL